MKGGLRSLLTRPVAFHPALARLGGSVNAGLMLSQALYWSERTDASGWFYKTREEWTEETYLTRWEQETARAKLCALGYLREELRGMPGRMHFRVEVDAVMAALEGLPEDENPSGRENLQQLGGKTSNNLVGKQPTFIRASESTSETTTETTAVRSPDGSLTKQLISDVKKALKLSGPEMTTLVRDALRVSMGDGLSDLYASKQITDRWAEYRRVNPPYHVGVRKFLELSMFLPSAEWTRAPESDPETQRAESRAALLARSEGTRKWDGKSQCAYDGCSIRFVWPDVTDFDGMCSDACREADKTQRAKFKAQLAKERA